MNQKSQDSLTEPFTPKNKQSTEAEPVRDELDATDILAFKQSNIENMPGVGVEFDPEEAEALGAFEEDAISLEDAIDASLDLVDMDSDEED